MKHGQIRTIHAGKLLIGIALVLLGLVMPLAIDINSLGVYDTLFLGLRGNDKVYVLYAALKLVLLNTLRALPHYLGAFCIGEAIEPEGGARKRLMIKVVVICTIIPLVYVLIEYIYGIHYDFGVPAFISIALLLMFEKASLSTINIVKKAAMVMLLIASMQLLDVMPALKGLPFGRGEASSDIKLASQLMGADDALQFSTTLLFAFLFLGSMLMLKLIIDENNLRKLSRQNERMQRERTEQRIEALEKRTLMELRNLVHDLKSPLTAAQALISVVGLTLPPDDTTRNQEYLKKAESSLEHMSAMISEILYEDWASPVTTEHVVGVLLSQLSNVDYGNRLKLYNEIPAALIEVNEIRFVRAVANVIDNAKNALPGTGGQIYLIVRREVRDEDRWICFEVRDNGRGIGEGAIKRIWDAGFSGRDSSGLGLSFVKQVVEQNHGQIDIESVRGVGTTVTITVPESGENDDGDAKNSVD